MQSLLDSRRKLSDSGWRVTTVSGGVGMAVNAAAAVALSTGCAAAAAAAAPGEMPDHIILLLTQREALLAAADAAALQQEYGQSAAELEATQLRMQKVSWLDLQAMITLAWTSLVYPSSWKRLAIMRE
jgi:hypothetical protein